MIERKTNRQANQKEDIRGSHSDLVYLPDMLLPSRLAPFRLAPETKIDQLIGCSILQIYSVVECPKEGLQNSEMASKFPSLN